VVERRTENPCVGSPILPLGICAEKCTSILSEGLPRSGRFVKKTLRRESHEVITL
jgi:hypothetical protein